MRRRSTYSSVHADSFRGISLRRRPSPKSRKRFLAVVLLHQLPINRHFIEVCLGRFLAEKIDRPGKIIRSGRYGVDKRRVQREVVFAIIVNAKRRYRIDANLNPHRFASRASDNWSRRHPRLSRQRTVKCQERKRPRQGQSAERRRHFLSKSAFIKGEMRQMKAKC